MACYQCGGSEGSESQLCKDCQANRKANFKTIKEQLLGDGDRWQQYWTIIKEEWHIGIIICLLICLGLYLLVLFLCQSFTNPEISTTTQEEGMSSDSNGHEDKDRLSSPPNGSPSEPGDTVSYTAEAVYNACLEAFQRVDTSTIDQEAMINAFKETYKDALVEMEKEALTDKDGKPLTLIAKILLLRARESCHELKTTCETDLRSNSCVRFARQYLND